MRADTLPFLRALFQDVPDGFLTLTAIHPTEQRPAPSRHVPLHDESACADAVERLCRANAEGWGAYFAVAARQADLGRWRRGGKQDLTRLPALFVDLDGDPAATLPRLEACPIPQSCLVSSGGGLHAYWFIQPTDDIPKAEAALHGLAQHVGGDRMNAAASLRLPGSTNTKPARHGAACRVLSLHRTRRYRLDDFQAFMVPRARRVVRHDGAPSSDLVSAVVETLLHTFDGYFKPNGYLAARCPCGHRRDYPGAHFNFDAQRGMGHCFGRHGRLRLKDLCSLLHI